MDYKTNIEFLDWLMWDKEVNEKEWLEASEEAKDAMFKEFEETRRKKENECKPNIRLRAPMQKCRSDVF